MLLKEPCMHPVPPSLVAISNYSKVNHVSQGLEKGDMMRCRHLRSVSCCHHNNATPCHPTTPTRHLHPTRIPLTFLTTHLATLSIHPPATCPGCPMHATCPLYMPPPHMPPSMLTSYLPHRPPGVTPHPMPVSSCCPGKSILLLSYMSLELTQAIGSKLHETQQLESSRMSSRPFNSTTT